MHIAMERDKKAFRKYYPNSIISDSDLTEKSRVFHKTFPNSDFVNFLQEKAVNVGRVQEELSQCRVEPLCREERGRRVWGLSKRHGLSRVGAACWRRKPARPHNHPLSKAILDELGSNVSFPISLLPLIASEYPTTGTPYPIVALPYGTRPEASALSNLRVHVSPGQSFDCKLRNVFEKTTVVFRTAKQSHRWLSGPNLSYWPQQLNLAVWCATSGCGVTGDTAGLPSMVQGFIKFHVYFTTRRILYEMGVPLPKDAAFNQTNNHFNRAAVARLCNEFGLPQGPDFRWKGGRNHGLGDIFLHYSDGYASVRNDRPNDTEGNTWPDPGNLFDDEGATSENGKGFSFIRNDAHGGKQYEWFIPSVGKGLTKAGLGRLNRSVETFVYCILGAQVSTRSSIVGMGGAASEVQQEMVTLFESCVIEQDISKSVQRYQLAVQEAKLRLDFAISPGIWLMPSSLVINTESVVGYNNELKRAGASAIFGVNDDMNAESKQVGINHNMGISKNILPHTMPKNTQTLGWAKQTK